jgi:hypothetical protein
MKNALRNAAIPVAILAVLGEGCATTYAPRNTGRIHMVMSSKGEEAVEKDGKRFTFGVFTGNLADAVSSNPAAEEQMDSYIRHKRAAGGGLPFFPASPSPWGSCCWPQALASRAIRDPTITRLVGEPY